MILCETRQFISKQIQQTNNFPVTVLGELNCSNHTYRVKCSYCFMMTYEQAWICQLELRGLLPFCSASRAQEPTAYKASVPLHPIPTPYLSTALLHAIMWCVDHVRRTRTEL